MLVGYGVFSFAWLQSGVLLLCLLLGFSDDGGGDCKDFDEKSAHPKPLSGTPFCVWSLGVW
jgi:hypothetical protein